METLNKNKNYQVHPDDVDVRGWNVIANGNHLGVVNDLVMDTYNMRIKYLDLIKKDSIVETNDHYLIPVDQVKFNRENKTINLNVEPYHFHNNYPGYSNEVPQDYEEKIRSYFLDTHTREYSDDPSRKYENKEIHKNRTTKTGVEGNSESPYGEEYEMIKNNPANSKGKIDALERQKQLKKIELERDIALIDEEINQLKANNKFKI